MNVLFLVGRILFGGFFLFNGYRHLTRTSAMAPYAASRGVPAPKPAVAGSGVLLVLGGLSVLLGFWPRWGVLCLVLFLVPVSFAMHGYWNDADPQTRQMNEVHFHKNMALLGAALTLLAIPEPWALSVGH